MLCQAASGQRTRSQSRALAHEDSIRLSWYPGLSARPARPQVLDGWKLETAPEHPWTVQQLLAGQAWAGRRVGMILDLSNHETLYADEIPTVLEYRHVQLVAKARVLGKTATGHRTGSVHAHRRRAEQKCPLSVEHPAPRHALMLNA